MNCHSDDYQDAYAAAWRELCRREGKVKALPRSEHETKGGHLGADVRQRLKAEAIRLRAQGLTYGQIGLQIGMSEHFARVVCSEDRRKSNADL